MQIKPGWKVVLVVSLIVMLLPVVQPAHAITTAVGRFYANCSNFSVDVAVNGTNNDGNNLDKFRYQVTDSGGRVLYQEDATRTVGVTTSSLVINMPFTITTPTKNPVIFSVIDLDANGNTVSIVQQASYDADCLPRSGTANRSGDFRPPHFLKGTFVATTPIFQSPGAGQMTLSVSAGKEQFVLYRSADSQWVAIDVGGNQLVWVPVTAVNVNVSLLNTPPTHIDLSQPGILSTPVSGTVPGGVVATARVTVNLRLRSAPSLQSTIYTHVPADTQVPVYGRNSSGTFIKVNYNGMFGWVSAPFVFLIDNTFRNLPVVE